jgi:hypothetical protein
MNSAHHAETTAALARSRRGSRRLGPLLFNALEEPALTVLRSGASRRTARDRAIAAAWRQRSAVFGVFADKAQAEDAAKKLSNVAFSCACESI